MDSGATSSATYDQNDCINVIPCNVQVTAAGTTFAVTRMGTAFITAATQGGETQTLHVAGGLISTRFPFKLLALQSFTNKGHTAVVKNDLITISNPFNSTVLLAGKDQKTKLFFLNMALSTATITDKKIEDHSQRQPSPLTEKKRWPAGTSEK